MKTIVFGVGNYYREQKEKLNRFSNVEILAFADNNPALWNKMIDGILVISPESIKTKVYDIVMIMSIHVYEIHEQLLTLGVEKDKIITWEYFFARAVREKRKIYTKELTTEDIPNEVLIISTDLNYNGGTLAAIYASMALRKRGMSVVLAAPDGNNRLINEVTDNGIPVVILPALPYIFDAEKKWIQQFKIVIVNTFQMIECACEINKIRPVLWWIHEPSTIYKSVMGKLVKFFDLNQISDINIYAVSKIAQQNFNREVTDNISRTLTIGIPDKTAVGNNNAKKIVFAIIGNVSSLKAQDIFLNAASEVNSDSQAEFWIIGKLLDNDYCRKVREMAESMTSVRILGELTRSEIHRAFSEINVVVCTSQEETLSIACIEAMMYGKVCIAADSTGIADYIQTGVNGFVVPVNDVQALTEKMIWIIENRDKLDQLGRMAWETYKRCFTIDILGENLEMALNATLVEWPKIFNEE